MVKPFFKWPGSKSWLVTRFANIWPTNRLHVVEPFVGSAAFFLGTNCSSALLADTNRQVVDCLLAVRDKPKGVLAYLSRLTNTLEHYVRVRDEHPRNAVAAAGRLIFLTNTSWGGLYRENRDGRFNVPFGNNRRSFYCEDAILTASIKLKDADIRHWHYQQTLSETGKNDLVFVDAPYVTKGATGGFDRYHATRFSWGDQADLAKILTTRSMRSRKILVTCAANPDLFHLFPNWKAFEFSKRNSMTAHMTKSGYRTEALLVSPALSEFAVTLEEDLSRQQRLL